MRLLPVALIMAFLVAGCAGSTNHTSSTTLPLPIVVSPSLTAIVHKVDAVPLAASAFGAELPRMSLRYVAHRSSGEPTIAVNAKGQAIYASIAFDAVPDNPTNAVSGNVPKTIVYETQDEGRNWTDRSPAVNAARTDPVSLDPFVYSDPKTGRLFNVDLYVGCANLQYTDDGGMTWITNPVACGVPVDDHQSIAAGPVRPPLVANPFYPRVLYYCVNQLAASTCSHSLDGGLTWVAGQPAYGAPSTSSEGQASQCAGLTGHVATSEKSGTVFLPAGCGHAEVSRSTDNGMTWTPRVIDSTVGFDGHDGSVAVDANGTVYYFFLDGHQLPRLLVSHDDGVTWSAPLNVTAPGVTTAKFPAITAGAGGKIAFLYVGSTTPHGSHYSDMASGKPKYPDEYHNATWNAYVGFSLDAASGDPTIATVTVNDPADPLARGDCDGRCYKLPNDGMFDFLDIQSRPDNGEVWVSLVDQCVEKCAQPDGKDTDLFPGRGAVGVQVGGPLLGSRLPH